MSKLQILIPQYTENEDQIKPLLDSIAMQQDIDLKEDIEVFIGNDGSDVKLSVDFLKQYPYRIQYHFFEHSRLAGTRKNLFQLVTAPYVMWCDADDKFINTLALSLILQIAETNCDAIIFDFLEQQLAPSGRYIYGTHTDDATFVHGKIYRTEFLRENKIEWHPELHEHQDSSFNVLSRLLAKSTRKCKIPIYLWCYNPNSICRHDGKYHKPNTWPHMIDSYQALIDDLKDRGMGMHSCYYAKNGLYSTYYEMQHAIWAQDDVEAQKADTYKRLVEYYRKNELLIKNCDEKMTEKMDQATKENALKKGPLVNELPPFEEWLNSILTLY